MCMISGEIETVSKTNIFTAIVYKCTQLTVYSNHVDITNNPVAMILPVPKFKNNIPIKMLNLSETDLFSELNGCCKPRTRGGFFGQGTKSSNGSIKVERCGSYQYSIVDEISEFENLDNSIFKIDFSCLDYIKKFYGTKTSNFAFLVCIIDKSADYSPIAYIHESNNKTLFIPTRHYHDHKNKEDYISKNFLNYLESNNNPYINKNRPDNNDNDNIALDWDHSIYTIDSKNNGILITDSLNNASPKAIECNLSHSRPHFKNNIFKNIDWSLLKQRKINGQFQNGDILIYA